jgi:hypothetical protein
MGRDDHSPTEGTTRRGVLRGLGAATAGAVLPAVSATGATAEADSTAAAAGEQAAVTPEAFLTDLSDLSPYSSNLLRYTDIETQTWTYENRDVVLPGEYQRWRVWSLVTHGGPQVKPGYQNHVIYGFNVQTIVTQRYLDANKEPVEPGLQVWGIKHDFDMEGDGWMSFNRGDEWAGAGALSSEKASRTIAEIRDKQTVRGAAFDFLLATLFGQINSISAMFNGYNAVNSAVDAGTETESHEDRFKYSAVAVGSSFRRFAVTVPTDGTATLDIKTTSYHTEPAFDTGQTDPDVKHTLELDPDTFVHDIGKHPFEQEIRKLLDQTAVSGYPNDYTPDLVGRRFRPEQTLTRAEFVSMVDDVFDPSPVSTKSFPDIDGHWAEEKIERVAGAGYVSGYPDGEFKPNREITKLQVLLALNGGLNYSNYDGDQSRIWTEFDDPRQIPDWARQAVANVLAAWGDIKNYPDQRMLEPNENATRAEAAKYVYDAAFNEGIIY